MKQETKKYAESHRKNLLPQNLERCNEIEDMIYSIADFRIDEQEQNRGRYMLRGLMGEYMGSRYQITLLKMIKQGDLESLPEKFRSEEEDGIIQYKISQKTKDRRRDQIIYDFDQKISNIERTVTKYKNEIEEIIHAAQQMKIRDRSLTKDKYKLLISEARKAIRIRNEGFVKH